MLYNYLLRILNDGKYRKNLLIIILRGGVNKLLMKQ